MATSLGDAVITVGADTRPLKGEVKKGTEDAFDSAKGPVSKKGTSLGKRFAGRLGKFAKKTAKIGMVGVGVAAGAAVVAGFKSGIDAQKSEKTLSGLYNSAGTAKRIMKDLRKVSKSSSIDYSAYTKTAETLAYMGVAGKDVGPMLDKMGKMITGAGGSSKDLERAGDAMLKMVNSGKVYAADLNQLSATGIPVISGLATKMFGDSSAASIAKMREAVSAGKVSVDDVQSVIQNATGKNAKAQIRSAKEVEKTLSATWKRTKDNVVTSIGAMSRPLIEKMTPAIEATGDAIIASFSGIGKGLSAISTGIGDFLRPATDTLKTFFKTLSGGGEYSESPWMNKVMDFADNFRFAWNGARDTVTTFLKTLSGGGEYSDSPWMNAVMDFADEVRFLFGDAIDVVKAYGKAVGQNLQAIMNIATPLLEVLLPIVGFAAKLAITAAFAGLQVALDLVKPIIEKTGDALEFFGNLARDHKTTVKVLAGIITAIFVPALIQMAWQAAVSGAETAAIWVMLQASAIKSTIVQAGQFVLQGAKWAWLGMKALAQGARVVAGWALTGAGAVAATAVALAQFALQGARWVWMGVQATAAALKVAAAWIISMGPIAIVVAAVVGAVVLIIKYWDKIGPAFGAVWTWIKKYVFAPIGRFFTSTIPGWVRSGVGLIKVAWTKVQEIIKAPFVWIRTWVFNPIGRFFKSTIPGWIATGIGKIRANWTAIQAVIMAPYTWIKANVFNKLSHLIKSTVPGAFAKGVGYIKKAWKKLEGVAKKPVNFLINTVYMGGIRKLWNKVAGAFHMGKLKLPKIKPLSEGGYTGKYNANTPTGLVHGDEHVIRSSSRRKFERKHPGQLDYLNLHGDLPGYKKGGLAGGSAGAKAGTSGRTTWPVGGPRHQHMSGYPWARWAGDMPVGTGTPVHSYANGVVSAVKHMATSYGNHIRVNHGSMNTLYAHLQKTLVGVGQKVKAGQVIGKSDSTGNSTGPHLHFEIAGGSGKIDKGGSSIWSKVKGLGKMITNPMGWLKDKFKGLTKGIGKGDFPKILANLPKRVLSMVKEKFSGWVSKFGNSPKGEGSTRWAGTIATALKANGLPTSPKYMSAWLKQVQSESSGNAKARQGIFDINSVNGSGGAMGLLQTIPATFNANKFPGHGDIFNGLDNALAAIRYAKKRYGAKGMLNVIGHGHGYAGGTLSATPGWGWVGERGPELINFKGGEQVRTAAKSREGIGETNYHNWNVTLDVSDLAEIQTAMDFIEKMKRQRSEDRTTRRSGSVTV